MELKDLTRKRFTCDNGEGKLFVDDNGVYLCQNFKDGSSSPNKLGYKYSYQIFVDTICEFLNSVKNTYNLENFTLYLSEEEIKDIEINDPDENDFKEEMFLKVNHTLCQIEKIDGKLVFVIEYPDTADECAVFYTKKELLNQDLKLVFDNVKVETEEEIVEVTIDDVAKMMGKNSSKIRIKE